MVFKISGTILATIKANDNDRQTEDIDACGNKLTFFDLFFLLPRQVPPPFPAGVFLFFFSTHSDEILPLPALTNLTVSIIVPIVIPHKPTWEDQDFCHSRNQS